MFLSLVNTFIRYGIDVNIINTSVVLNTYIYISVVSDVVHIVKMYIVNVCQYQTKFLSLT